MRKHKNLIIGVAIIAAVLAFTFFMGGFGGGGSEDRQTPPPADAAAGAVAATESGGGPGGAPDATTQQTDGGEQREAAQQAEGEGGGQEASPGYPEASAEVARPEPTADAASPGLPAGDANPEPTGDVPDPGLPADDPNPGPSDDGANQEPPDDGASPEPSDDGANPEPPDDSGGELSVTLLISCASVLDNMDKLRDGMAELIPVDGILLNVRAVFYEGESVFNVLLREVRSNRIHMEFTNVPIYNSAYIEGIGNLYEFDCGERSGWMYSVNGVFPNYGSSRCDLRDGDVIRWLYTCERGEDIGGGGAAGSYGFG